MRLTLAIFFIIISIKSFGQVICPSDNFDLYNDRDTINLLIDGLKQGKWLHYDKILSCNDCNDCRSTYAILTFQVLATGNYHNDKKVGNWIYYHNDTLISRYAKYLDGEPDSIDTSFDIKGNVLSRIYWNMGDKDSVIVNFESGKLKYKGVYHLNKLSSFKIYYPNGKTKYEATEISGLIANDLKYHDQFGELIEPRDNDISRIGMIEDLIKYFD